MVTRVKELLGKSVLKVGHFGSLDPFAEGLLLIGASGACKLNQYVQQSFSKTYIATGLLGVKTTTGDLQGDVITERDNPSIKSYSQSELTQRLSSFIGDYRQTPPQFSAVKHKGRSLYKYARAGVVVKKDPVLKKIFSLEILEYSYPRMTFRVEVSSGTYVRTLFEDMAQALGTVGHLMKLVRSQIGHHSIEGLSVLGPESKSEIERWGLTLDQAFPMTELVLGSVSEKKFLHGQRIPMEKEYIKESLEPLKKIWVFGTEKKLLGMAERKENELKPVWVIS
jgi:tRNA pseudouridine55 synthase